MLSKEERLQLAARNAVLGDGYLWKHPECLDYKAIWTSVDMDWLRSKQGLFGDDVCSKTITVGGERKSAGVYPNARPIHTMRSYAHPIFTEYRRLGRAVALEAATLLDFALWYLDDGCLVWRTDSHSYRFVLCVGNVLGLEESLLQAVTRVTGLTKIGSIRKNNSRATDRNKSLYLTVPAGEIISRAALSICPPSMRRKIPSSMFNDQPKGVGR